MTTRSLRDILRRVQQQDLGFRVLIARDVIGPGGAVFIAAHAQLTERHLTWLEQRNPVAGAPTYVEVVFAQERASASLADHVEVAAEAPETATERRGRAAALSRQVGARAEEVARQAREVYRLVGETAFSEAALRNPRVQENLHQLEERLHRFHSAVRAALDEYLAGHPLIMELIAQLEPGTRAVTHGLNVAVLATELASQILLKDAGDRLEAEPLRKELVEVFVGGFLHDCGLWNQSLSAGQAHEVAGARLVWHLSSLRELAPDLVKIVLFHSEALRMAARPALVQVISHADDPERLSFACEFHSSAQEAQRALARRSGASRAELLDEEDLRKVLPVAMAEYCITQAEGFYARTRPEIIARLAAPAGEGLYARYAVALCNAQVEVVAPRRAWVALDGHIPLPLAEGQRLDLKGFSAGSLLHGNDPFSPHLIALWGPGPEGRPEKLAYLAPQDSRLWERQLAPAHRFYVPAGRYRASLALQVTGFMSETAYANVLGECEQALRQQMQA
jgi:hypothetical protein